MTIPKHKTTIMVHCLDTPKSWGEGKTAIEAEKEVHRWHTKERGWLDTAYAVVIGYAGDVALGRDLDSDGDVYEETGAGAKDWNKNTIHLALVGGNGGSKNDSPSRHYTAVQLDALRREIEAIQKDAGRRLEVIGHNQVANKACPCFNVPEWYAAKPVVDKPKNPFKALLRALGVIK